MHKQPTSVTVDVEGPAGVSDKGKPTYRSFHVTHRSRYF
ncbi:hypothetical protein SAMN05216467_0164 [Cellulomonas sp. KH9]|nr:hypothetical protein SAMN05216467_0164 [Cellulomonas sp. KH9]